EREAADRPDQDPGPRHPGARPAQLEQVDAGVDRAADLARRVRRRGLVGLRRPRGWLPRLGGGWGRGAVTRAQLADRAADQEPPATRARRHTVATLQARKPAGCGRRDGWTELVRRRGGGAHAPAAK